MIHTDHLGTPHKMTGANQAVVWSAYYKPFGAATVTVSTIFNNLRFPGQYFDAETGLNYNYFRDYNPIIGRYVEADPIGIQQGDNHLYAYVENQPINQTDTLGLCCDAQLPASPINEVARTCYAEASNNCSQGDNEKRAISDAIYNRARADERKWGGNTVLGVLEKKDRKGRYMFQGYKSSQYDQAANPSSLDDASCKKLKACINAANAASSSAMYDYTSFNKAGTPNICQHRFFKE
jgi:RHS repeat-associated protein